LNAPDSERLTPVGRALVAGFFALALVFGAVTEMRSAFLKRRMTDLGCYLRGAWAVRTGGDMYRIQDDNGWHYNYPPLFAILMTPLADPPAGVERGLTVPWAWSVAIVYALNFACLMLAVHLFANHLTRTSPDPAVRSLPRFSDGWWMLRLAPIMVTIGAVGLTLGRGQVNHLVLLLAVAAFLSTAASRSMSGGALLATAAAIKVIPAFLFLLPLAGRRRLAGVGGVALGLVVTMLLIPIAALGPERTASSYRSYAVAFVGPMLGAGGDKTREREFVGVGSTCDVGLKQLLHHAFHPRTPRSDSPPVANHVEPVAGHRATGLLAAFGRRTDLLLWFVAGVSLTALVMLSGGSVAAGHPLQPALRFSLMMALMTVLSPVSHQHYFVFLIPLVQTLLVAWVQYRPRLGPDLGRSTQLTLAGLCFLLPSMPGLGAAKLAMPLVGALLLIGLGQSLMTRPIHAPRLTLLRPEDADADELGADAGRRRAA
jgi:hypothetical protein